MSSMRAPFFTIRHHHFPVTIPRAAHVILTNAGDDPDVIVAV